MACLATGHVGDARRAGDLLVHLVEQQPDPTQFYYRCDLDGRPLTEVPEGAEIWYFVDSSATGQIYFNPGIALILLMHLFRATDHAPYLAAGQRLLEFCTRCAADVPSFPPSGKLGMGSALLYAVSGNETGRRAAEAVGGYLVETQTASGYWELLDVPIYRHVQDQGREVRLDITAEFTIFLIEIAALI